MIILLLAKGIEACAPDFCTVSEAALLAKSMASTRLRSSILNRLTKAPIKVSPAAVVSIAFTFELVLIRSHFQRHNMYLVLLK